MAPLIGKGMQGAVTGGGLPYNAEPPPSSPFMGQEVQSGPKGGIFDAVPQPLVIAQQMAVQPQTQEPPPVEAEKPKEAKPPRDMLSEEVKAPPPAPEPIVPVAPPPVPEKMPEIRMPAPIMPAEPVERQEAPPSAREPSKETEPVKSRPEPLNQLGRQDGSHGKSMGFDPNRNSLGRQGGDSVSKMADWDKRGSAPSPQIQSQDMGGGDRSFNPAAWASSPASTPSPSSTGGSDNKELVQAVGVLAGLLTKIAIDLASLRSAVEAGTSESSVEDFPA